MSSVSGSVSKGEKAKSKYVALDINNLYKGKSLENPKTSVLPKHGLQSLGKVGAGRRMPPPANLPSLKSENSGNLNINLVPSGGQGWGSSTKEKAKSEESQTSSHSQPQPTSTGSQTSSQTSPANSKSTSTQGRPQPPTVSSNSTTTTTTTAPPSTGKTWSTVTSNQEAGGREPTYLGHQSPYFRQEFPKLAGGNAPTTETRKSAPDYTPGPSLRPQTEGSWGRGAIQPSGPSPATASQAPNSGSGVNGPICSTEPLSRGTPPLYRNNPSYINNRNFSGGFSNTNYTGMPSKPSYSFSEASNGRNRPPRQIDDDQRPALIIKDKDLKGFDRLLQNDNQDAGWSAPHEEIDYNAKLVFSDDEDGPQSKDLRLETSRNLASSKTMPGKESRKDDESKRSWNKDKTLNKYFDRHVDMDSIKTYSEKEENRLQQQSLKNWNPPPPTTSKQQNLEISSQASQTRHWPSTQQRVPFDYRGPKPPAAPSYPSTNLRGNTPSYPLSSHGTSRTKDVEDEVWQDRSGSSPAPDNQQQNLSESHVVPSDGTSHQPARNKKEDLLSPLTVEKQSAFESSPSAVPTPPSHLIDQEKVTDVNANEERITVRSRHSSETTQESKHIKEGVSHIAPNNQGFFSKQFPKYVPPRFQKQHEQLLRQQQFQSPSSYPHHHSSQSQQPLLLSSINFDSRWSTPLGPNMDSFNSWNTSEDYEKTLSHTKNYDKVLEKDTTKENFDSILNNNRIISRKENIERSEENQPLNNPKNTLHNFYEDPPKNWDKSETIEEKPLTLKSEGTYQDKRLDWGDTPYPMESSNTSFKQQRHYLHGSSSSLDWNAAPHRPMPITQSQLESLAPTKKNFTPLRRTGRPAATLTNLERKPETKKEEALDPKNRQHVVEKSSHIEWSSNVDISLVTSQKTVEISEKKPLLDNPEIIAKGKEESTTLPETSDSIIGDNAEIKKDEQYAPRKHPIDGRERRSRGRNGGNSSYNFDPNNPRGGSQGGPQGYRGKSREYRRSRTDPKGPRFERQRDSDVKNDKKNSFPDYNNFSSHKISEERKENVSSSLPKEKIDKQEMNDNKDGNYVTTNKIETARKEDSKTTQSSFERSKDNSFSPKGNERKGRNTGTLSFRRGGGSRRMSNRYGPPSKAPFNYRRSPKQEEGKSEDSSKENRNNVQTNEISGDCATQQIKEKQQRHSDRPPHRKANRYDCLPPRLQKRQANRPENDSHFRGRGNRNSYQSNSNINHKESDAANEEWETASESSDIAERKDKKKNAKDEGRIKSDIHNENALKKNNYSSYNIENKYISNNNRNSRSDFREGYRSNNYRGRGKKNLNDGPNGRNNEKNTKNNFKNNEQSQKSNFTVKNNNTPTTLYRVNEFNLEDPNNIQAALSDLTNRKAKNDSALSKISKPDKTNNLKGYDLNNYAGVVIIDDRPEDLGGDASHGDQDDGFQEVTSKKRHKLIAENDVKKSKREQQPNQQHKGNKSGSWPRQNKLPPRLAKQRENSNKATAALNQVSTSAPIFETEIRPVQIKDSSPPMVNAWEKPISLKASSQPVSSTANLLTSGTMGLNSVTTGSSSSKSSSFDQHDSGIDVGSDQPASTTSSQRSSPSNDGKGVTTTAESIHDLSAEIDTEKPMCTVIFENKNFKAENAVLDKFGASHAKAPSKEGHSTELTSTITSFPEDNKKNISPYPSVSTSDTFSKGDKPTEVKLDFASLESDLNQLSNSNIMTHPPPKPSDNVSSTEEINLVSVKKPCYKVWDGLPLVLEHTSGSSAVAPPSESAYHPSNASLQEFSDNSQGGHKDPSSMVIVDDTQTFGSGGNGLKSSGLVVSTASGAENNGAKLKAGVRSPPPPVPVQLSSPPPPVLFNSQQQQQAYPQRPFHQQYTAYTTGGFNQQTSLYMTQQDLYPSTQFRPYTQTPQHSAPVLNTQATNPHLLSSQLVQSRPSHLTGLPAAAASSFYSSSGQNYFHQPASSNFPPNQQSFGSHNILPPTAQNFRSYGTHPQFKPVLTPEPSSPTIHDSLAMFQSNSNSQLVKQPAPAPKATPAAYYPFSQPAAAKFGPPPVRPVLYPVQRPPPQTPQFVTANPPPYPTPIQRPASAGLLPPPTNATAAAKLVAPSKISSAQQAQQRAEAIQQAELFFTRPEKNASVEPSVSSEDKPHLMTSRVSVESSPAPTEEAAIDPSPSSLDASQVDD